MMGPLEIAEPEASLPAPEFGAEAEVVVKPGANHLQGTDQIQGTISNSNTRYNNQIQISRRAFITHLFKKN